MVELHEQLKWEEEMTTRGIERYRNALAKAVQYGEEHMIKPQYRLMMDAIEPVAKAIDEEISSIKGAGRRHKGLRLIEHFDRQELALLVSKSIMQGITSKRSYLSIASTIGNLLEEQHSFNAFKLKNKGFFDKAVAKARKNPQLNETMKRRAIAGYAKHAKAWVDFLDNKQKIALGSYLIKVFADTTGLIKLVDLPKKQTIVEMSDKCSEWLKKAHDRCELLAPVWLPMISKPNPWTAMYGGGYYTKRLPVVKQSNKGYLEDPLNTPSKVVLDAVNAAQDTGWKINQQVFNVAATLWESSSTLAGLPSREHLELPERPCAEAEVEAFKVTFADEWASWKRQRKEIHEQNARLRSHRLGVAQTLETAQELMDKEEFFYVWTLDWRGRMYPVAGALNPQGNSLAKGLLMFSEGKPLGDRGAFWLKIGLANTFGIDKVSYEDRIQWVEDHATQISMCALDPYTFKMWTEADSPWEFLANCFEFEQYQREGTSMISYVPQKVDGSCNGLQHLSSCLHDQVGCIATNVAPSAKPNDIYGQVASLVSSKVTLEAQQGNDLAKVWYGKVDRSVVKRNVMTVSYGATQIGMLEQLREDLGKAHNGKVREWLELDPDAALFDLFWYLAERIQEAIAQVVKAAPSVMTWVQDCAVVAAEEGLPLRWTTPAGFNVLHAYRKQKEVTVDSVLGNYRIYHRLKVDDQEMNKQRTKLAISPNVIHSWDASHAHQTIDECRNLGITSFAMVHDSYGTHACDMDQMSEVLRTVFAQMYSGNMMLDLYNQMVKQVSPEVAAKLPLPPAQGSFDVSTVTKSRYFFA